MSDQPNTESGAIEQTDTVTGWMPPAVSPPPPGAEPEAAPAQDADWRPWHGHINPLEALYQHFTAELAKLRG